VCKDDSYIELVTIIKTTINFKGFDRLCYFADPSVTTLNATATPLPKSGASATEAICAEYV